MEHCALGIPGPHGGSGWVLRATGTTFGSRACVGNQPVIGIQRVDLEGEIVDQRVIQPEASADGGLSFSERVPRHGGPGREQTLGVVLGEEGIAHARVRQQDAVAVGDVVGSASRHFIPSCGEFMPEPELQREIAAKLDGIVDVPGSEQASESERGGRGNHLEVGQRSLQERGQARERGDSELAGRGVLVVLKPLEPDAGSDLMLALVVGNAIREGEQIAAIPDVRIVARARRRKGAGPGGGLRASDRRFLPARIR